MTITTGSILEHEMPFKEAYYHVLNVKGHDFEWAMNDDSREPIERLLIMWHIENAQMCLQNEWAQSALSHITLAECMLFGCLPNMIEKQELHTQECANSQTGKEILQILKKARSE